MLSIPNTRSRRFFEADHDAEDALSLIEANFQGNAGSKAFALAAGAGSSSLDTRHRAEPSCSRECDPIPTSWRISVWHRLRIQIVLLTVDNLLV